MAVRSRRHKGWRCAKCPGERGRPPPSSRAREAEGSKTRTLPMFLDRRNHGSLKEQSDHTAQHGVPAGERRAGSTLLQRGGVLERTLQEVKRQHQIAATVGWASSWAMVQDACKEKELELVGFL